METNSFMEITESQTSAHPTEPRIAVDEALPPRRSSVRRYASEVGPFLAVVVQFGLIVLVVGHWQLESRLLTRLLWLAFGGFIIHHVLPMRFRLSFFATLSLLAVITGVGHFGPSLGVAWLTGKIRTIDFLYHLLPGLTLIGIGLGLIGLCHLPCLQSHQTSRDTLNLK